MKARVWLTAPAGIVAVMVVVRVRVPVAVKTAVYVPVPVSVTLPMVPAVVPLEVAMETTRPDPLEVRKFPTESLSVKLRVAVCVLEGVELEAVKIELTVEAGPGTKVTVPPVTAGEVKKSVLVSGTVDFKVQVETPTEPTEQIP